MSRLGRRIPLIIVAVLTSWLAWIPANAGAGEYIVKQCEGSGQRGFEGVFSILGGADRVDVVSGCIPGGPGKIGVYQDRSGVNLSDGVGGQFAWDAPAGAGIIATTFDLKMKDANGIIAAPVGRRASGGVMLDGGRSHDGSRVTAGWSEPASPLDRVAARLVCRAASCANRANSAKAFLEVFDLTLILQDSGYPLIFNGKLGSWKDIDWYRGPVTAMVEAGDDGSGITRIWLEVNGRNRTIGSVSCPGLVAVGPSGYATSTVPCPARITRTELLNSTEAPFEEGMNRFRFCAEDYFTGSTRANRGCGPMRTVWIDNLAPAAPVSLRTEGGSEWRAENGFSFSWEDPPDQTAPLTGGSYRLLGPEAGSVVASGELGPEADGSLGPLDLPEPGEYELELRLRDAAGNLGSSARAFARFDNRPPGDVAPEPAAGWVSEDELPLDQTVGRAEAGGPSGVAGYALAVSSSGPVNPCPEGSCLAPQIALNGGPDDRTGRLPNLSEGSHWVSAVATSGAAVASVQPGSAVVRVDRTVPETELNGNPAGWSNRPVTVTASASDELSGMLARPGEEGEPETVIQAEGLVPYRAPGPVAEFTVTTEGASLVRFWGRDLAGNAGDGGRGPGGVRHPTPQVATVRIDTEAPELTFTRQRDPADPERIEVETRDGASGTERVEVAWRRAGSTDPFRKLAATPGGRGRFVARMPSDDLPRGIYELRASGTDRAGNTAIGDRAEDGESMLLRLPLKQPVRITAGLGKQRRAAIRTGFGEPVRLGGRILAGGRGLSGVPVTVTETFKAGSRPASRRVLVRADGTGRFALKLRPGPGRRVSLSYPGNHIRSRARSRTLRVESRGRVSLSLRPTRLRNGGRVTMRGRVGHRGALIPARGKLVAIQYFDPGRAQWRPVELLRTGRGGRFSYRYRFRTITSAQRIIFRAISPAEAGWPYLHSTSRGRSVIVYPGR